MTFDYFTYLNQQGDKEATPLPWGYVSGWVDHYASKVLDLEIKHALAEEQGNKRQAKDIRKQIVETQKAYRRHATKQIPVRYIPCSTVYFSSLPSSHWLAFQVGFELLTPWYSRDDRVFHVMDNPVRKDRVFGVPFMAASSWKGMLRWACRMQAGLQEYLATHGGKLTGWQDPDWIQHLFGNEKGETEHFQRGALAFYPTWFNRIGFEVINPHSRARRAGTQPIYYEVVPPKAQGTLSLLYAPWPGMKPAIEPREELPKLLEAIEDLLTIYGISAKRTVGWGTARITQWKAFHKTHDSVEETNREDLWNTIQNWLSS